MRVGIDVRACLGPGAGMNTYTRELLLSLARTPEVELVMWCAGRRPERLRQLLLPELLALDPAVPLVTRRLSNQLLYSLPALAFWQRWPRLVPPPRVLPRDLDLYHAVFWPLPLDPTIPRVQTIHDLLGLRHAAWATAQMRAEQRTIVALAPRAAWVIVDSEATRADVLDRCRLDPERVTTVPLGVDARFAEPVPPDCLASARERHGLPDRYLVSLATRDPRKNLGRLIDAYDLIVDQLPAGERLDLVLIGAGGWGGTPSPTARPPSPRPRPHHWLDPAGRIADPPRRCGRDGLPVPRRRFRAAAVGGHGRRLPGGDLEHLIAARGGWRCGGDRRSDRCRGHRRWPAAGAHRLFAGGRPPPPRTRTGGAVHLGADRTGDPRGLPARVGLSRQEESAHRRRSIARVKIMLAASLCLGTLLQAALAAPPPVSDLDVVWTTPSADSSGSMPLGNGDLGLNLWVEPSGEVVFLLSKTDAWSDNGRLLKLGRVRVKLAPAPTLDGFEQRLDLAHGALAVRFGDEATIRVWVDANAPVVRLDVNSATPRAATAALEIWRTAERRLEGRELFSAYGLNSSPEPVIVRPDTILAAPGRLLWCHRNEHSVYPASLRLQGLDGLVPPEADPLLHRTFGGALEGEGFQAVDPQTLVAPPAREHHLRLVGLGAQTPTLDDWTAQLERLRADAAAQDPADAWTAHTAWWEAFWQRSWIRVECPTPVAADEAITIADIPLRIGADSEGQNRFHGGLARAWLLSRALSEEEVVRLAQQPDGLAGDPAVLGDWSFAAAVDGAYPNAAGGRAAQVVGQVSEIDGPAGKAVRLDGRGYLEVANAPDLNLTRALTLAAWIAPDQLGAGGARIIDRTRAGTADGYLLDTWPGNSLRMILKAGTLRHDAKLQPGRWVLVAATFDGVSGRQRLYVDGRPAAAAAIGAIGGERERHDPGFVVSQGYALQRFITACAGRGGAPIKFNGSIFTVDSRETNEVFDPDYRRWGGPYWFQNTRLAYWPMLRAGDLEMLQPLFRMYLAALPLAEARTRHYFGHGGAFFPETMTFWGGYADENYGWHREGKPVGQVDNTYIRYYYDGALELLALMLAAWDHARADDLLQAQLLPFARAILSFYDEHYERVNGKLHIAPSQALETWQHANDPLPPNAGLHRTLDLLLALPIGPTATDRQTWTRLRAELPPIPQGEADGQPVLLPAAEILENTRNSENPELYAIFPYHLYGVGLPDLALARTTFAQRRVKRTGGWTQDAIQAAYLGLTDQAAHDVVQNFATHHGGSRFPAFWGPNYDWIPDQDHGGVAMLALQSMLLQEVGEKLLLLPAWPANWDVAFKLHAGANTVVEGEWREGALQHLAVRPSQRAKEVEVMVSNQD